MIYNFFFLFMIFIIYSFIGYLVEIICVSTIEKKLTLNRGFLILPYLPIYGVGSVLMTLFLTQYKKDIIVLFIMSMVICTILEYVTSYIMEKIFKLRWWDYTQMKYNINGRVCLSNGALFGIGGVIIIEIVNPFIYGILYSLPTTVLITLGTIFLVIFILDLIMSVFIMFKIKINVNKYVNKDATATIRREVSKALGKYSYFTKRLFKAFPNINPLNKNNEKKFKSFKELIFSKKLDIKKLKDNYKKKKEQIKNKKSSM